MAAKPLTSEDSLFLSFFSGPISSVQSSVLDTDNKEDVNLQATHTAPIFDFGYDCDCACNK